MCSVQFDAVIKLATGSWPNDDNGIIYTNSSLIMYCSKYRGVLLKKIYDYFKCV